MSAGLGVVGAVGAVGCGAGRTEGAARNRGGGGGGGARQKRGESSGCCGVGGREGRGRRVLGPGCSSRERWWLRGIGHSERQPEERASAVAGC